MSRDTCEPIGLTPPKFAPIDSGKNITVVVTEDCNLRCRYCYLAHKNPNQRMTFDVARRCIDYLLERRDLFQEGSVTWDFIGGEPLLEIPLLEQIIDFIFVRSYELNHPWFTQSQFSITTNGLLYCTDQVQRFVERYRDAVEITISIDGPEHVHDRARVTAQQRGSYAVVRKSVDLWLKQYPNASTKVTISQDNVAFVAESILHLFELGIKEVSANTVFEDVWNEGDDLIFEQQLDRLGEEMIRTGLWRSHRCSLFGRDIGKPLDPQRDNLNWCGSGRMLAIDAKGTFYPCNRFLPFSLNKHAPRSIGNINTGIDFNRVRPFLALTRRAQSNDECFMCKIARGCAWCQGFNYDAATTPTIYQRATYICRMHKARVRSNERYFRAVDKAEGKIL